MSERERMREERMSLILRTYCSLLLSIKDIPGQVVENSIVSII